MADRHRPGYWKDYYDRKKKRPRQQREKRIVISVSVPASKKSLWKSLAADTPLSRFVEEAVDDYVAELGETR